MGWIIALVIIIALLAASIFIVKQKTAAVIERLGKFHRVALPGLNFRIPIIDQIAQRVDLRVQQIDMDIETKTEDNVTVLVRTSIQFEVAANDPANPLGINPDGVKAAVYSLSNPGAQIRTYVADAVRGKVPNMSLDETFSDKAAIAEHVSTELQARMGGYGFHILNTLVPDVAPTDARVLSAMNNVMASLREKEATINKAQAEKSATIIRAEADRDRARLAGEGVALQRKAIAEGLAASVRELGEATDGDPTNSLAVLMFTQQVDAQIAFAEKGNSSTVLLPPASDQFQNTFASIQSAILAAGHAQQDNARARTRFTEEQQDT
jgi:regulator of protease activity HflC (stomatin/prohibitin superfamily)